MLIIPSYNQWNWNNSVLSSSSFKFQQHEYIRTKQYHQQQLTLNWSEIIKVSSPKWAVFEVKYSVRTVKGCYNKTMGLFFSTPVQKMTEFVQLLLNIPFLA